MNLFSVCQFLFSGIVRLLTNVRGHNAENMPKEGAVLLVSNHLSNGDIFSLGATCKRPIRFMAKAELFKIPVLAQIVRAFGAFPINRAGTDVDALKNVNVLLSEGNVVGIFPQGTRCPGTDPAETRIKPGVGLMAYRSHATVVPALIKTKDWKISFFRRRDVYYGKPIPFEELGMTGANRDEYKRATEYIFSKIVELGE